MSDSELAQEFEKLRRDFRARWRRFKEKSAPYLRPKTLRGQILDQSGAPIVGAGLVLNRSRRAWSDRRGEFTFRFIFQPSYNLTLEWRDVELADWVSGQLSDRPVTSLKVQLPTLIRGQLLDERERPIPKIPIFLDQSYGSYTDLHGIFVFPREDDSRAETHTLSFRIEGEAFQHELEVEAKRERQVAFVYHQGELFHLDDHVLPPLQDQAGRRLERRFQFLRRGGIALAALLIFASLFSQRWCASEPATSAYVEQRLEQRGAATPREPLGERQAPTSERPSPAPDSPLSAPVPVSDGLLSQPSSSPPPRSSQSSSEPPAETEEQRPATGGCDAIEFVYLRYQVPRGMEGFVLSRLFSQWQSWSALAEFNGLDVNMQLQAGQRVKLLLPLRSWRRYQVQRGDRVSGLLSQWGGGEDLENGRQLLSLWNPHAQINRLRVGDELLYNPSILADSSQLGGATLKKLRRMRRFPGVSRRQLSLRVPQGCTLP